MEFQGHERQDDPAGRGGRLRCSGRACPGGAGRRAGAAARHHGRAQRKERQRAARSEEHTSELQSLMRISYAVFCLKKNISTIITCIVDIRASRLPRNDSDTNTVIARYTTTITTQHTKQKLTT